MSNEEKYPGYSDDPNLCLIADNIDELLSQDVSSDTVLSFLNQIPRDIAFDNHYLQKVETKASEFLESAPEILLEEVTDDWLAERRNEIKNEISVLKRQDEALKAERDSIDAEFIRRFNERGTSGTRAARFTVSLKEDDKYPQINNRTEFEEYVLETGKLHLLQKRLSLSSIQEEYAAMGEMKTIYLNMLNDAKGDYDALISLYKQLSAEDTTTQKVVALDLLIQEYSVYDLQTFLKNEINRVFTIPGIEVITKYTINEVKRK